MYVCTIGWKTATGHLFLHVLNEQRSTTMPLCVFLMLKTACIVKSAAAHLVLPVCTVQRLYGVGMLRSSMHKLFWSWCKQGGCQNVHCSHRVRNYGDIAPHQRRYERMTYDVSQGTVHKMMWTKNVSRSTWWHIERDISYSPAVILGGQATTACCEPKFWNTCGSWWIEGSFGSKSSLLCDYVRIGLLHWPSGSIWEGKL